MLPSAGLGKAGHQQNNKKKNKQIIIIFISHGWMAEHSNLAEDYSICMNDSVRLQLLNQCMSKHMDCMADFGFHAC